MAGYVLKIVVEDTHPPVWRRVILPEKVTFSELHEIIQIIFDWSDSHLHEFSIPSEYIRIGDDEKAGFFNYYAEDETLVDEFLPEHKWIRYIYDFGDEWRHKIIYEKTDETYDNRFASLLKVRGDNFMEDCGGVWEAAEDEWSRRGFEQEKTVRKLRAFACPVHDELVEKMYGKDVPDFEKIVDRFMESLNNNFHANLSRAAMNMPSYMARKINQWRDFLDSRDQKKEEEPECDFAQLSLPFIKEEDLKTTGDTLKIVPGTKTQAELLCDLGLQEVRDYCKYLQIPAEDSWTRNQMAEEVAKILRESPEYILYILQEDQYKEFLRMSKLPCGIVREPPEDEDVLIKAMSMGLADITVRKHKNGSRAELSFATDLPDILKPLKADLRKKTYRKLEKFSEKLRNLILVYGLIDLDSLYEMFRQIYHETASREEIYRNVYWYARMNNLLCTAYDPDGKSYVFASELDAEAILADIKKYAANLDYVMFLAAEIKKMAEDISERSDYLDILFTTLHYRLGFSQDAAGRILEKIFTAVMNGDSITDVLDIVYSRLQNHPDLAEACELWKCAAGLMLEIELPMLKGRSRNQYENETGMSSWKTGMLVEMGSVCNSKEQHIYEFPVEIQETVYRACEFVDRQAMNWLWNYQEKEKIKSEEFLYLLAEAYTTGCEFGKAEKLIQKLTASSAQGRQEADILKKRLDNGWDVIDDDDFDPWYMEDGDFCSRYMDEAEPVRQPYVRETAKIGRNDPCPCGSGKKYKKCCGRNN